MQGRRKTLHLFLVALIISLMLSGCGGGTTGSTWFNVPSIPVRLQPDGTAKVFGFNIGPLPLPLQQLQAANIQKLEVRLGYDGIFAYSNGENLPYIKWDEGSTNSLIDILKSVPGVPSPDLIGSLLPWARTIGLGASIHVPPGQGQSALTIPGWSKETKADKPESLPVTIGPLNLSGVALDPNGSISVAGMPLSQLGVAAAVPANITQILQAIKAEKIGIKTATDGLNFSLNDKPLPSLGYDAASLGVVTKLLPAFGLPQATVDMIAQIAPQLPGAQIDVNVSTTGQPAGDMALGNVPLQIAADGSLTAFGLPLGAGIIPASLVGQLQGANIQQLAVNIAGNEIALATNGQALPVISYDPGSVGALAKIAEGFSVPAATLNGGLELVNKLTSKEPLNLTLNLPGASGDVPAIDKTMKVADLKGLSAPKIHLQTAFDAKGTLTAIGGFSAEELAGLGIPLSVSLPPNILSALTASGASALGIKTEANKLHIELDGKSALSLSYDEASLRQALALAKPFLGEGLLSDPNIAQLIDTQILPLIPAADVDVNVALK